MRPREHRPEAGECGCEEEASQAGQYQELRPDDLQPGGSEQDGLGEFYEMDRGGHLDHGLQGLCGRGRGEKGQNDE